MPSREANSMHVMRMCQAFGDLGHDVTLHIRRGAGNVGDEYEHYGVRSNFRIVKYERPQVRVYGALVNARLVARGVRKPPLPELMYSREVYGLVMLASTGVPYIYESHWKPKHFVQQALEGWLFRQPNFRRLVLISNALRDLYVREFPWLSPSKMVVAHDAADLAGELPTRAASSRFQVGYVGGFLPGYGIDMIVKIAEAMPNVDFHVVGGKEHQLSEWRGVVSRLDNLTLHGFVPPAQLPFHYAGFDAVLAPYQSGTAHIRWISPMKLFEYMAHGMPIVCSDFPVMREVVTDGETGLLVTPEDVQAWVDAIDRLRDPALRRNLASGARAKLRSDHTWLRRAEAVLSKSTESADSTRVSPDNNVA